MYFTDIKFISKSGQFKFKGKLKKDCNFLQELIKVDKKMFTYKQKNQTYYPLVNKENVITLRTPLLQVLKNQIPKKELDNMKCLNIIGMSLRLKLHSDSNHLFPYFIVDVDILMDEW